MTSPHPVSPLSHLNSIQKTLITQEIPRVLWAQCQGPETKTKYIFLFIHIFIFPLSCHPGHLDQRTNEAPGVTSLSRIPFLSFPTIPIPLDFPASIFPQSPSASLPPSPASMFTEHPLGESGGAGALSGALEKQLWVRHADPPV